MQSYREFNRARKKMSEHQRKKTGFFFTIAEEKKKKIGNSLLQKWARKRAGKS